MAYNDGADGYMTYAEFAEWVYSRCACEEKFCPCWEAVEFVTDAQLPKWEDVIGDEAAGPE